MHTHIFTSMFIITASNIVSRYLVFLKIYPQNMAYSPLFTSSEGPWALARAHGTGPWDRPVGLARGLNRAQGPLSGGFAARPPFGRPSASKGARWAHGGPFGPKGGPSGTMGVQFGSLFGSQPPDGPK